MNIARIKLNGKYKIHLVAIELNSDVNRVVLVF